MNSTLSLIGCRAYAACVLRHAVFGWISLTICIAIVGPFAWLGVTTNNFQPFAIALGLVAFAVFAVRLFSKHKLELNDAPWDREGAAGALSLDIVRKLHRSREVTAADLFDAAARSERGAFVLHSMGMEPALVVSRCREELQQTVGAIDLMIDAWYLAAERGESRVTGPILIIAALRKLQEGERIFREADVSTEDIGHILQWEEFRHMLHHVTPIWTAEEIARRGSMGRSWVMGYTNDLDRLTTDIAENVSLHGERKVMIHKQHIEAMRHVIARSARRNILILGKVGVGKRTLVENFAATLRTMERENSLPFTRVLQLQTEDLLSGTANPDSFLLQALSTAQSSGSFILVIRNIAMFLSSGSENLRGVVLKFLETKNIAVIGIADTQDYHAHIKTNPLLDSLFEKIDIQNTTDDETMDVLMAHALSFESKGITIMYKSLRATLDLCKRYLATKGLPGVAREVLDDAVQRAGSYGDKTVLEEHVREAISLRGRVNIQKMSSTEKQTLLSLEDTLQRKIIGQEIAVRAVSSSLKRARADIRERKRPIGTFLFLGPTGVGKTQTAKVLAQEYFGSTDALVRLDMNEYSHADSVFAIAGSASGGEGFLVQRIQDNPFSLILLDEIEKAHPSVLNLFLQILDEGFMTDARGNRTDFRNSIIIATSNAGALFIRDFIKTNQGATPAQFKTSLIDTIIKDRLFSPEFINRFDDVVLFYPLKYEDAQKVAILMIDDVVGDLKKRRGIDVQIAPDVLSQLIERGYSIEFGAREMRRVINDMIEDYLADYLLRHDVQRGDTITIHASDIRW